MKIKGKFIIPLVAILIAMFTLGVTPGAAADTTVTASDMLTYTQPTPPATSSFEEEVEVMVSDLLGDDLQQAEGPLRGVSEIMEALLQSFRNVLTSFIKIFENIGGKLGDSNGLLEDALGGIFG